MSEVLEIMKRTTHCYIAKRHGEPGAYAACVDAPEYAKDTAKFIGSVLKEGGYVERVTIGESGALLSEWVRWRKQSRAAAGHEPSGEKK